MVDIFELKSAVTGFTNSILHALDSADKSVHLNLFIQHALHYIDKPYIWGGNDPYLGCDCSGFLVYLLRSHGLIDLKSDYSSEMLRGKFPKATMPKAGAIVFYGKDAASHCMLCLSNRLCIGSQGGGPNIKTVPQALEIKARIRIMPIRYRTDVLQYNYPFDLVV